MKSTPSKYKEDLREEINILENDEVIEKKKCASPKRWERGVRAGERRREKTRTNDIAIKRGHHYRSSWHWKNKRIFFENKKAWSLNISSLIHNVKNVKKRSIDKKKIFIKRVSDKGRTRKTQPFNKTRTITQLVTFRTALIDLEYMC